MSDFWFWTLLLMWCGLFGGIVALDRMWAQQRWREADENIRKFSEWLDATYGHRGPR